MIYEPALTISGWPEARFGRAIALTHELENRINAWTVEKPLRAFAHLSEDGRRLELRLKVESKAPLQEISLLFGAVIHELRSSLDAVVYALAAAKAGKDRPDDEDVLAFPIVRSPADWKRNGLRKIAQLEDGAIAMIEAMQPYNAQAGKVSPFEMIHDLDIIDKHRRAITIETVGLEYLVRGLRLHLTEQTELEMFGPDETPALEDGAMLGGMKFSKPTVIDEQGAVIVEQTWLVNVAARKASMADVLQELTLATRLMLDQLYGHPVQPGFTEWVWETPGAGASAPPG